MRIEYEGVIEQQPSYQHVGYTAAAFDTDAYVSGGHRTEINAWSGMVVLGLAFGLIVSRRWGRSSTGGGIAAILLGLALVGGGVALGIELVPDGSMTPQFHATLYRLEGLCAATDAWVAEHGRPPTAEEWAAMHEEPPLDGWGHPFEFTPYDSPGRDGRLYCVTSLAENHGHSDSVVWDIPSWWLGRDGRFGTDDDWELLSDGLSGVGVERYAHYERGE